MAGAGFVIADKPLHFWPCVWWCWSAPCTANTRSTRRSERR